MSISERAPEPGEVSLETTGATAAVRYSHARCGAGRIVRVDELDDPSQAPTIAFQPYCIPDQQIAAVFWESPNQALVAGDKTIEDGEAIVWSARGAGSMGTMDSFLTADRDELPLLEDTYGRFVPDSGLEVWFTSDKAPSLALQLDGVSSFEGVWLVAASQAGEIRIAMLTDVMRRALGSGQFDPSGGGELPEGAVIAGRVPFSAV